jgi:thioesterase domain-containing protein
LLGPDQPFYGIRARGLYLGEQPTDKVEAMASEYLAAVREVQPAGPYRLFGYCLGGMVAFEMARQLHQMGETVALLGMLETYAPRSSRHRMRLGNPKHVLAFLRNLPGWLRDNGPEALRSLWTPLVDGLGSEGLARRFGVVRRGQWSSFDSDRYDAQLDPNGPFVVRQAHLQAVSTYAPTRFEGSATLYRVRTARLFEAHQPRYGWEPLFAGELRVELVEGRHRDMLFHPHLGVLASKLGKALAEADAI